MPATQVVYADDTDAAVLWVVTDELGQDVDWANPQIAIGGDDYVAATWQGDAGPSREIRLAMPLGLGLGPGLYAAYLKVPNGNDFPLGPIRVSSRT